MKKDFCSFFPEHVYIVVKWFRLKRVYIGDCCKGHDEDCSFKRFFKCIAEIAGKVWAVIIATGGEIGCWTRHFKWQIDKMKK